MGGFEPPRFAISCFQLLLVAAPQVVPQASLEFEGFLLDSGGLEGCRPEPVLEDDPALAVASGAHVPGVLAAAGLGVGGGGDVLAHDVSPLSWLVV